MRDEIRKIDALALGQQPDTEAPLTPDELAHQLDARLTQLKEQVIHDYCNNRVPGEMVLLSILSILSDSRTQLRVATGRKFGTRFWPSAGQTRMRSRCLDLDLVAVRR